MTDWSFNEITFNKITLWSKPSNTSHNVGLPSKSEQTTKPSQTAARHTAQEQLLPQDDIRKRFANVKLRA